jgi:nitrogen-specific signal transduction histidine kinase
MLKSSPNGSGSTSDIAVPFDRIAGLVHQLTHDVRNGLNTLDLQAAFLQELVTDPEVLPEVKRIRTMIGSTAKMLQSFSSNFSLGEAHPVTYAAQMFVEDFRARLVSLLPEQAPQIAWSEELGEEAVAVDIELIFRAFSEFFKNAFHFREKDGEIAARVFAEGGRFVLELREGKSAPPAAPETWGREPLVTTRRGGFGMGLFHARRILAVHQGAVEYAFDPAVAVLTTRISLPLAEG